MTEDHSFPRISSSSNESSLIFSASNRYEDDAGVRSRVLYMSSFLMYFFYKNVKFVK